MKKIISIAPFPMRMTMEFSDHMGWREAESVGMALTEDGELLVLYHDGWGFMMEGKNGDPEYIDESSDPTACPF